MNIYIYIFWISKIYFKHIFLERIILRFVEMIFRNHNIF